MVNSLVKDDEICNTLQRYAHDKSFETSFEFSEFDAKKSLFDYQIKALQNAYFVLDKFYNEFNGDKFSFYKEIYQNKTPNLDNQKPSEILLDNFENDGTASKPRINFSQICNQMGFWMTTGSGKTIVAIKLIQMLDFMMSENLIPKKEILFFSANENLLNAFANEIENFNQFADKKINFTQLKKYDNSKSLFDEIKVYYYRADLLSDENKEKIIDYKSYLNGTKNYIILDEAHKGDKQDSKRQNIFCAMSKEGFLFNFSATFTDKIDIVTTIYNLNQLEWIKQGYGKKMLLFNSKLDAFKDKSDFNDDEKEIAILQSLIILTFQKKNKIPAMYHNPLMVVFLNSVNVADADAKLFFRCIERICKNDDEENFNKAKEILINEFKNTKYILSDDKNDAVLKNLSDEMDKICLKDVRSEIFYTTKKGNIEAKFNANQSKELVFKLDNSEKYFMLLRIGDAKAWENDVLGNIKVTQGFDKYSYFESIDENSINILVGSRSFYEGWDSTRPNIMLFLNIAMDKNSKKFVTQCIGRGMRIQSHNKSRLRLAYLNENFSDETQQKAALAETLFVYATNKQSVEEIFNWQKELLKQSGNFITKSLIKTPLNNKILYIPRYKTALKTSNKINSKSNFAMSKKNIKELEIYTRNISDKLFALRHKFNLKSDLESFKNLVYENKFYQKDEIYYKNLNFMITKIKKRLTINSLEFDKFSKINDEIIHFEKIQVKADFADEFSKTNSEVIKLDPLSKDEITRKIKNNEIDLDDIEKFKKDEIVFNNLTFKKIKNHYYNAILYGKNIEWIKNIINNESEIEFIKEVAQIKENLDEKYDWWMFSRINEHHDNIFVPYIMDAQSKKFYPDFIFWLQNSDTQKIVFIDPKGTSHTDYEFKADGFKNIFCKDEYYSNTHKIKVKLYFYDITNSDKSNEYRNFWIEKGRLKNALC